MLGARHSPSVLQAARQAVVPLQTNGAHEIVVAA
jgi:hypothetical protein